MPRYSRNALCGNFFHVIVQGLNKEYIFYKDCYKERYRQLLIKESTSNNIKIIAYCIMNNHAHILMFVDDTDEMSKCMHKINTNYAKFYNREQERVGFVFRDRFYTQPIKNETHLLRCVAYIHKNPVKAGLVNKESDYKYSSYNEYTNLSESQLISDETIKLTFNTSDKAKIKEMFNFIHNISTEDEHFLEIKDDINYNQIIEKYKLEDIPIDDIIIRLHKLHELSTREIADLLNITRYKVRKILDEDKKVG